MAWAAATSEPTAGPEAEAAPAAEPALPPITLSATVERLLQDPVASEAERRRWAIFHGQWDRLDELSVAEQAEVALRRFDLTHTALAAAEAPARVRAEAAWWRGEAAQTLALLAEVDSAEAAVLRVRALQDLGRSAEAVALLEPWRQRVLTGEVEGAAELTAAAEALTLLAGLEGRPAQDYQRVMNLLGQVHGQVDRLYWPALVAEARLLRAKDNPPAAEEATLEALRLNPMAGEAWYELGRLGAAFFQFEAAEACIARLRAVHEHHLLADLLEGHLRLNQKDAEGALKVLTPALARFPQQRELLALHVTAQALRYDEPAFAQAMQRYQEVAPGNPLADLILGRYLSLARQYQPAEEALRRAIAVQPNSAPAHVELGLLLMQSGDEEAALETLRTAARLDPFNLRAANQLKLTEELLRFEVLETDHFIIRYQQGIDAVLARDMPEVLEGIYRDVTEVYQYQPPRKTLIELLPDERYFAVRITGVPEIWTVAAATGDVIALTPPRIGSRQRGSFDWARVLRHEFVHTVTLNQTAYRIPHWFTEAAAVSQEPGGRDYDTCLLLATALEGGKLFDLDQINWAFVRPKTPMDRPLAYAQAHWMYQFLEEKFGRETILGLMTAFREGLEGKEAIRRQTGLAPEAFMERFKAWAGEQVVAWGLGRREALAEVEKAGGLSALEDGRLEALLADHPDRPDLLQEAARRALAAGEAEAARRAVLRYQAVRPVDPWPYQALVTLAAAAGDREEAITALRELDRQAQRTGGWAYQAAELLRAGGHLPEARQAVERALHREPYHPGYRELAGAIALQQQDLEGALRHLRALPLLEPHRAVHQVRLAALLHRLGQADEADQAARAALALDPAAPVEGFMRK